MVKTIVSNVNKERIRKVNPTKKSIYKGYSFFFYVKKFCEFRNWDAKKISFIWLKLISIIIQLKNDKKLKMVFKKMYGKRGI